MNCGIEVLKRLNEIIEQDLSDVIETCEEKLTDKGLNMYELWNALNHVLPCKGIASLSLCIPTPFIAFIGLDGFGHYVLVERIDKFVWVYDPSGKLKKCSKIYFYLLWSKKAIIFML